MATNKDNFKKNEAEQPAQTDGAALNPFKDAEGTNAPQPSVEEEAALEQQRKEALTERD